MQWWKFGFDASQEEEWSSTVPAVGQGMGRGGCIGEGRTALSLLHPQEHSPGKQHPMAWVLQCWQPWDGTPHPSLSSRMSLKHFPLEEDLCSRLARFVGFFFLFFLLGCISWPNGIKPLLSNLLCFCFLLLKNKIVISGKNASAIHSQPEE